MSATIGELATALGKAQAELKPAPMDSVNKFLGNRYADLGAIIETAKPVMLKNGLAISQLVGSDGDRVSVTTVLMHTSGEWIKDTVSVTVGDEKGKSAAQTAGSLITYLRRYSLSAIMGIYADEDADGGTKTQPETKPSPAPKQAEPAAPPEPHWSEDADTLRKFWAWTGSQTLSKDDVHTALHVTHLKEFSGDKREAMALISAYVTQQAGVTK